MRFFLDENFPRSASDLLSSFNHESTDIRGTRDQGADDRKIFDLAQKQRAVFLTTDRDFFHTIPHLYEHHFGVIVIALRQPNRQNILHKLEWFLQHFGNTDIENKIFQLRDRNYVIYPTHRP